MVAKTVDQLETAMLQAYFTKIGEELSIRDIEAEFNQPALAEIERLNREVKTLTGECGAQMATLAERDMQIERLQKLMRDTESETVERLRAANDLRRCDICNRCDFDSDNELMIHKDTCTALETEDE